MTADSFQLTACSFGRTPIQKHSGAVSRRPMVIIDALAYDLYSLAEQEIGIVDGGEE